MKYIYPILVALGICLTTAVISIFFSGIVVRSLIIGVGVFSAITVYSHLNKKSD